MKSKATKAGFDHYFSERTKDRNFASTYREARAEIDSVDAFMRSLEEARAGAGVSKAKLAQLTGTLPAAMRRLLTTDAPNPTLATVMNILNSLGLALALVPKRPQAKVGRARKAFRGRRDVPANKSSLRSGLPDLLGCDHASGNLGWRGAR